MRYFIYACEQLYGGLHGMNSYCVVDLDEDWSEEGIWNEYVYSMSHEVMESYSCIMNTLEDSAREAAEYFCGNEDDLEDLVEEYLNEEMAQNVDGYVIKIRNDVDLSTDELDSLACQLGPRLFREQYCESEGL